MIILDCPACMVGEHSKHVEHWGVRPEGVIDGEFCRCTGDCKERFAARFNEMTQIFLRNRTAMNDEYVLAQVAGAEQRFLTDAEFHAHVELVTRVLDMHLQRRTGQHLNPEDASLARHAAIVSLTLNAIGGWLP